MLDDFVRDSRGRARLQGTGLAASLEAFSAYLRQCGHAGSTIAAYRHVAGHFARWLAVRKVSLRRVDEATVRAFTHRHLPQCRCPRPGPRTLFSVRAALHHWLIVLRRDGSAPPPASGTPATIARAVADFDAFLADTCGLAEATRGYRRRYVREFLQVLFGAGPIEPGRLRAADIERYVVARARRCTAGSARVIASSIRSWLRFQQMLGASPAQLVAAVPRIPCWRLASLPSVLDDADLDRLLAACHRPTPTGRRDYAMARCLVDLGLRAHEVAGLELCDLDWRRGAIRVPASGPARRLAPTARDPGSGDRRRPSQGTAERRAALPGVRDQRLRRRRSW